MRRRFFIFLFFISLAGFFAPAKSAQAQFGELPPFPVSSSKMGSANEIVLNFAFDPATVQGMAPNGLRLRTLEEVEKRLNSPELSEFLKHHPEYRDWAYGYIEIIHPQSLEYDGFAAKLGERGGMAIWYAYAGRTDQSDTRPRGYQLLSLGTWLSDRKLVALMRSKGYPAEYAEIELREERSGVVRGRLKTADLEIRGQCRLVGDAFEPDFGKPPFLQTIWTPRAVDPTFEVITFFGHVQRKATEAGWKISGKHPLVEAFRRRIQGDEGVGGTEYFANYSLRGALFRR